MSMTHYMELLMINSPWNLLLFMALPVVLAETIAITELIILHSRTEHPRVEALNRVCGILAGVVFVGIAIYLIPNVVIPVTQNGEWRTWIDVLAVAAYIVSGIPMVLIALMHLKVVHGRSEKYCRQGFHVLCVACFLVLSHIAMIAGMADPAIAGYEMPAGAMMQHDMGQSGQMTMQHDMSQMNGQMPMQHNMNMGHDMSQMNSQTPMQHDMSIGHDMSQMNGQTPADSGAENCEHKAAAAKAAQ